MKFVQEALPRSQQILATLSANQHECERKVVFGGTVVINMSKDEACDKHYCYKTA